MNQKKNFQNLSPWRVITTACNKISSLFSFENITGQKKTSKIDIKKKSCFFIFCKKIKKF